MFIDEENEADSGVRPRQKDVLKAKRKAHSCSNGRIASEKYVCLAGS